VLSFAILLDAGFVKRKLKQSTRGDLTAAVFHHLIRSIAAHDTLRSHRLHRVYFYDAQPLARSVVHPITGEAIEYGGTPAFLKNTALLRDIARLPNVALRQGELSHDGWTAKWDSFKKAGKFDAESGKLSLELGDLKPVIRQKGVDMRIGMDIAALTLKKHVQIIALVTADSDFVPAMKFARREGAQLYLYTLSHGIKDEMIANSDLLIDAPVSGLLPLVAS
jgi:uncharacterized LabA/DUF88 family protein